MNDFDAIIDRNGKLLGAHSVSSEVISSLSHNVPKLLLELWHKQGVGSWSKGLFNLCLPHDFNGLLSQIFHADKDLAHSDCHIFAYSAFGNVYAWSERHGLIQINLTRGEVIANDLTSLEVKSNPEHALTALLYLLLDDETLDVYDDNDKKLFTRAVKKLGRPGPGQVFGFTPALAMGGAPNLKNLKIVPALEHFLFLAQLQQFKLVDYLGSSPNAVRLIG